MPAIARSIGVVTNVSTSTGPRAGAGVITCTWTFVTSGTASMPTRVAATEPSRTKTALSTRTTMRFLMLHEMSASINRSPPSAP